MTGLPTLNPLHTAGLPAAAQAFWAIFSIILQARSVQFCFCLTVKTWHMQSQP